MSYYPITIKNVVIYTQKLHTSNARYANARTMIYHHLYIGVFVSVSTYCTCSLGGFLPVSYFWKIIFISFIYLSVHLSVIILKGGTIRRGGGAMHVWGGIRMGFKEVYDGRKQGRRKEFVYVVLFFSFFPEKPVKNPWKPVWKPPWKP